VVQALTYDNPNFVGELFQLTPTETPFLSMIGGLTGGIPSTSEEFTWQSDDLPAAAQNTVVEGADPTYSNRLRTSYSNVCQILQKGVEVSYTKQAATGSLGTPAARSAAAASILGNQPIQDELSHQLMLKTMEAARDTEFSFIEGVYQRPTTNATDRQTRGILPAITTNDVDATATSSDTKANFLTLVQTMADNGARFQNPVVMVNSFQKTKMTAAFTYAPESRNVGGVNLQYLETDFAEFGVVYNRHVPASQLLIVDVAFCAPVFLEIPGKGHFFAEPLAQTGAAWKWQLYGEVGLRYGPEIYHGKVTDLDVA
jgi:hypothetical protein